MERRVVLGIDPGSKSGAAAIIEYTSSDSATQAIAIDLPIVKKGGSSRVSPVGFNQWLQSLNYMPTEAWLEDVHSMPRDGVKSAFAFGHSLGAVEGVIAALSIPYYFVTPTKWQKVILERTAGKNHEFIRAAAVRMFPEVNLQLKKDHNRAAALLIAFYGLLFAN